MTVKLFLSSLIAVLVTQGDGYSQRWPSGAYGLPQSMYGCPENTKLWSSGTLFQPLKKQNKKSSSFHLAANVTSKGVSRSFCIREPTTPDSTRPSWPSGKYCIYRKGGKCPNGLKRGSLVWDDRFDLNSNQNTGKLPDGLFLTSSTLITFCCAVNGNKSQPISLPLESPFYLIAYKNEVCQAVIGALSRAEYIYYHTETHNVLTPPHPYKASAFSMQIYYCYYQACYSNFTSLTGTIMSPFYPSDYPPATRCRWTILVPADYHITLYFDDIDLETPSLSSCLRDWLLVRTGPNLSERSVYCAKQVYPALNTKSNMVVLEFHSDRVATANKGFRIHYKATHTVPLTTAQPLPNTTTTSTRESSTNQGSQSPSRNTTTMISTDWTTTIESTSQHSSPLRTTEYKPVFSTEDYSTSTMNSSTPAVHKSRAAQSYTTWTVIVAVCLVLLVFAIVMLVVYFKCLRKKRDQIERRQSTVRYSRNRECDYVDMDYSSDSILEAKGNQTNSIPVYDNYPSEDESENLKSMNKEDVKPIYETINEPKSTGKSQENILYEAGSEGVNIYEELSNPKMKPNLYENASLTQNMQ